MQDVDKTKTETSVNDNSANEKQKRDTPGKVSCWFAELRKKLKVGIKQYKKEWNLSYKTSFRFYKYAYPIRSKAYRKLRMN